MQVVMYVVLREECLEEVFCLFAPQGCAQSRNGSLTSDQSNRASRNCSQKEKAKVTSSSRFSRPNHSLVTWTPIGQRSCAAGCEQPRVMPEDEAAFAWKNPRKTFRRSHMLLGETLLDLCSDLPACNAEQRGAGKAFEDQKGAHHAMLRGEFMDSEAVTSLNIDLFQSALDF